jgi:divalent metal cation (Fe/Co/Zn/Cd) transporter
MKFSNSKVFIDKLNNLFNGLIALPLLLVGFGYLEISSGSWTAVIEPNNALIIGMVTALVILVVYLSLRFKRETRKLVEFEALQTKMAGYYGLASFYYWAVFALSAITTALLFLYAHLAFAVVYAFILFWMSIFRPTLRSLADLFGLKDEEKEHFMNREDLNED